LLTEIPNPVAPRAVPSAMPSRRCGRASPSRGRADAMYQTDASQPLNRHK